MPGSGGYPCGPSAILCACSEFVGFDQPGRQRAGRQETLVSVLLSLSNPGRQRAGRQEVAVTYLSVRVCQRFFSKLRLSLCLMTLAASELAARSTLVSVFLSLSNPGSQRAGCQEVAVTYVLSVRVCQRVFSKLCSRRV